MTKATSASWGIVALLVCSTQAAEEETAKRKDALEKWALEPVSLESMHFLFHLDRKDGSFFFQDKRSGTKWFSSWGRRGFASVLLGEEGRPPGAKGADRWITMDRAEVLESTDKKIRFRGASTQGDVPAVTFEVEAAPDPREIDLRFEIPAEAARKVSCFRLLDDCLWIPDTEKGGVALPAGMGEWHPVDGDGDLRRRLHGIEASPCGGGADPSFELRFVGCVKSANPLLVRWLDPAVSVEVTRRAVNDAAFPGSRGLFISLDFPGPSGAVHIATLGKEEAPVLDLPRAYRLSPNSSAFRTSLRSRSGTRPGHQSFVGAAILRPKVGAGLSFDSIASYAEHISKDLGIDQAAFILRDWSDSPVESASPRKAAGGTEGLQRCSRRVQDLGFIFGVDAEAGPPGAGPSATWKEALARSDASFEALKDLCQPQLVLFGGALGAPGGFPVGEGKEAWEARAAFGRRARETFGLVGFRSPVEPDLESAAFLEGLLDPFVRQPLEPNFWPLLTGGFGQCLRIGVSPDVAVRPGQPSAILAHLLLGEVPTYEFPATPGSAGPAESGGGPDDPFSRDDGWAKGKNLSRQDIFLKNTYEVLSHTARHRLREELWYHQALTPDGTVRECFFGPDLRIVVNFGTRNYEDKEDAFVIPPAGFVVRHPFVYAFHALRVNDVEYERPAFFVVRSLEGKMYLRAEQVNIYHGFGPDHIQLGGKTFRVEREAIVKIW